MNSKSLIWISLSIALVLHLAFFSLTTFVFPINPDSLKPKFFFLGPILSKNDVDTASLNKYHPTSKTIFRGIHSNKNDLKSMNSNSTDQTKNPFAIQAIKKPLISQSDEPRNKIAIKSTFDSSPITEAIKESEAQQSPDLEIEIRPYRPLQFRSP